MTFQRVLNYDLARLALFLLVTMCGANSCLELQEPVMLGNESNWIAPIINHRNVWPTPLETPTPVNLGERCQGQEFKIPPLIVPDIPFSNQFHFVWLLNRRPIDLAGVIEPEAAKNAIISLKIDEERLKSFFPAMTREDFMAAPMKLELHISDRPYFIPENAIPMQNALEDYMYWVISFREGQC